MKIKDTTKLYKIIGKKVSKDGFVGRLTNVTDSTFTLVNENGVEKTFTRPQKEVKQEKPTKILFFVNPLQEGNENLLNDTDDVFIQDMPQYYKEGYEIIKNDGSTIWFGGQGEAIKWLREHQSEVAPFNRADLVVKGEEPWDFIKFNVPARKSSDIDFAKNNLYFFNKDGKFILYSIKPDYVGHVNMQSGQGDFDSSIKVDKNGNPKKAGPDEHSYYLGTFASQEEMENAAEAFVNDYNKDFDAYASATGVVEKRSEAKNQNYQEAHRKGSATRREGLNRLLAQSGQSNLSNYNAGSGKIFLNKVNEERMGKGASRSDIFALYLDRFIDAVNYELQDIEIDSNTPIEISPQVLVVGDKYNECKNIIDYYNAYVEALKEWLEENGLPVDLVNRIRCDLDTRSYSYNLYSKQHYYGAPYVPSWRVNEEIPQRVIDILNINI